MDTAPPAGSGGVIAVYDSNGADAVDNALANAVKKSVSQIDGTSAKELKAGLAEARPGWAEPTLNLSANWTEGRETSGDPVCRADGVERRAHRGARGCARQRRAGNDG